MASLTLTQEGHADETQYVSDVCEVRGVQGHMALLKSFHFLGVEVELEADGYVQRDTRQLGKKTHFTGDDYKGPQPPLPLGCIIVPQLIVNKFQHNKHRKQTRDILIGLRYSRTP